MNVEILNKKYSFLFDIPKDYKPFSKNGKFACNFVEKDCDAFELKSPVSGVLKTVKPLLTVNDNIQALVIRAVIGYAAMSKAKEDFTYGCLLLSGLINNMLLDALEYNNIKNATFNRPGGVKEYFRELENSAGYELRLYVEFN